jgi:oxygen-independent coproporphyrinogen-3 oxidase
LAPTGAINRASPASTDPLAARPYVQGISSMGTTVPDIIQTTRTLLRPGEQVSTDTINRSLLETVSLYLHVPFCHTRCHYCDFNTYAGILSLREPYVRALLIEIKLAGAMARQPDGAPRRSRTIFFGGGTPSLLSVSQITRLLDACFSAFTVDQDAEITLEANPGTLSQQQLAGLREAGINRLSMGAQSFDDRLLKILGRIHTSDEITQAVQYARAAGFSSINLDLMFGLPEQSMQHWRETLDRALDLHPDHLSLYSLIVEEGTPFYSWANEGQITPGDEDLCADMYEYADELLQKVGYVNYEISNWALPGQQSRHNLTYWQNLPYIGMGAGAYSSFADRRFSNEREPLEYIKRLKKQQIPEIESETIGREQAMAETAFLALRTAMGLHLPTFEQRFAQPFTQFVGDRLRIVEEAGLLEHEDDWLRLSKRGRLLGNEVFLRLLPD